MPAQTTSVATAIVAAERYRVISQYAQRHWLYLSLLRYADAHNKEIKLLGDKKRCCAIFAGADSGNGSYPYMSFERLYGHQNIPTAETQKLVDWFRGTAGQQLAQDVCRRVRREIKGLNGRC